MADGYLPFLGSTYVTPDGYEAGADYVARGGNQAHGVYLPAGANPGAAGSVSGGANPGTGGYGSGSFNHEPGGYVYGGVNDGAGAYVSAGVNHGSGAYVSAGVNQGHDGYLAGAAFPPTGGYDTGSPAPATFTPFDFFSGKDPAPAAAADAPAAPHSPPGLSRLNLNSGCVEATTLHLDPFDDLPVTQQPPRSARVAALQGTFQGSGSRRLRRGSMVEGEARHVPPDLVNLGEGPSRRRRNTRSAANTTATAPARNTVEPRVTRGRARRAAPAAGGGGHGDEEDGAAAEDTRSEVTHCPHPFEVIAMRDAMYVCELDVFFLMP